MKNFLKGFFLAFGLLVFFILGLLFTKSFDLFLQENKTNITRNVEVSTNVKYDTYLSYPRFSSSKELSIKENLNDEERTEIINTFSKILEIAKSYNICEGGSYMLQPNISYKDGLQIPSGYKFDSNFKCKFGIKDYETYTKMLNEFNNILKDNKYIILNIPAIKSIVSDEALDKVQENLYQEVYKKSIELNEEYSKLTNKTCKTSNIIYEDRYPTRSMSADIAYSLPIEKDTLQRLKAQISLECK